MQIEGESAVLSGPMTSGSDARAFGGGYIYSPTTDSGTAVWSFSVPVSGNYYIWCRVMAPDPQHDSFYARTNGGNEDIYDDAEGTWSGNWQWSVLNGRNGTGVPLTLDPRIVVLAAGTNTLTIRGRELGSQLDRILITGDPALIPTDGNVSAFTDVLPSNPFYDFIETIARDGISSGCGNGLYCPDSAVTRAQMAVFLLRAEHGTAYVPPPPTGVFADLLLTDPFTPWIERLAAEGITAGCGNGDYCPNDASTRSQMAVFLVKTFHLP